MNPSQLPFIETLRVLEKHSQTMVWWKPEQIARNEHIENNPTKGERPWIIPETTGLFLYDFVIDKKCNHILELGTSIGYSTLWLAHAIAPQHGHIDTIERSVHKIPIATKNIADATMESFVTLHNGEILNILESFNESKKFDLVFMDADRGHYHEYFPLIKKHLLPGAWIIADNAGNMGSRMQPFFDLLTAEGWDWEIRDMDNGILIATDQVVHHSN